MRPTADHRPFVRYDGAPLFAPGTSKAPLAPNRLRWDPPSDLPEGTDFIDGLVTMLANRDPADLEGVAVHLYRASKSMERRVFVDADGELLIIPQSGSLRVTSEFGRMDVAPGSIALDPARREVSGRGGGEAAAMSPRITGYRCVCPSLVRSVPTASPTRATSKRRARGSRTGTSRPKSSRSRWVRCGRRRSIIRRSMSSPGTAILRHGATICRASTRSAASASIIPIRRSLPC